MDKQARIDKDGAYLNYSNSSGSKMYRGDVVSIGGLAGVLIEDIADGETGEAQVDGLAEINLKAVSVAADDICYWDEDADPVSGTAGDGAATNVQSDGDITLGVAPYAADGSSGTETVKVLLNRLTTSSATKSAAVPLSAFKQNDLVTPLATAGDGTNLGLVAGTHGTASPVLKSIDVGGTTDTETARLLLSVPDDYLTGDLTLTFHAGMQVVADDAATLDVQAYEPDGEAGVGSDLCETAAQDINSATLADHAFTIAGDALSVGDVLDVEITVTATDAGNAADNINAVIGAVKLSYTGRP